MKFRHTGDRPVTASPEVATGEWGWPYFGARQKWPGRARARTRRVSVTSTSTSRCLLTPVSGTGYQGHGRAPRRAIHDLARARNSPNVGARQATYVDAVRRRPRGLGDCREQRASQQETETTATGPLS